jgi:hypothetical protein
MIQLGVALAGDQATTVHWQAVADPSGLTASPSSGTLTLTPSPARAGSTACAPPKPTTQALSVTAPTSGSYVLRVNLSTMSGHSLPPVIVDVAVHQ